MNYLTFHTLFYFTQSTSLSETYISTQLFTLSPTNLFLTPSFPSAAIDFLVSCFKPSVAPSLRESCFWHTAEGFLGRSSFSAVSPSSSPKSSLSSKGSSSHAISPVSSAKAVDDATVAVDKEVLNAASCRQDGDSISAWLSLAPSSPSHLAVASSS